LNQSVKALLRLATAAPYGVFYRHPRQTLSSLGTLAPRQRRSEDLSWSPIFGRSAGRESRGAFLARIVEALRAIAIETTESRRRLGPANTDELLRVTPKEDDDHIAQLGRGLAHWNARRDENVNIRPDLSEAKLSQASAARTSSEQILTTRTSRGRTSGCGPRECDLRRCSGSSVFGRCRLAC
jgi:hypothetical protein